MAQPRVIVVGGGLAGLAASMRLAEGGASVLLFSTVPVKRSHSVCAQGGINAAVNLKGEGDSTWEHFDDTIYGGDFLADQPPVKDMCEAAPEIVFLLDRMGVPFNRTSEGLLDFRRFGGTKHHRTAFAGATTGQQLIYALDEQVRRYEVVGRVEKREAHEFLSIVANGAGRCIGICALDLVNLEVATYPADAVILATGGPGMIFGKSTNSVNCTGSATSAAYQQGAVYANGEFIQVHPTAIPGEDKLRLMSESARGEGGRVWTYKDGKPWYFLEEWYPAYGNLVPRDIATRAIFKVVFELGLGVNGENAIYLDVSHLSPKVLDQKLGGILEIYEKFIGDDPRKVPMKVFPGVHYSMGGLWVDFEHRTSIPGLLAAGECEHQYHGANRLGANALLSCIFAGMRSAKTALADAKGLERAGAGADDAAFADERRRQSAKNDEAIGRAGREDLWRLHQELGELMTANVTVVRKNEPLRATDEKLKELQARLAHAPLRDASRWMNQTLPFARNLENMLVLARVITLGALARDESRGAHYKPEFPERDDARWLKTTMARHTENGPSLSYAAVDTSLIPLRARKYDVDKKAAAAPGGAPAATAGAGAKP
jgi:succinate dehydrogenase / fumarate reductase flavoprotein subunit